MFCVGSQVQHETFEEGQRMHLCFKNNNKDEDNSPNALSNKNLTFFSNSLKFFLLDLNGYI